jgi:hypothetical protein
MSPVKLTRLQAKALGLNMPKGSKRKRATVVSTGVPFEKLCEVHGLPIPQKEYEFCPGRKWRFDWLFDSWLALEVQGALFTGGRHVRGAALVDEYAKLNEAVILGYAVLFCTPQDIESGAVFALIRRALNANEEQP